MNLRNFFIVFLLLSLNFVNVSCVDPRIPGGRWLALHYAVKEGDMEEVKRLLSGEKCPPDTWDIETSMNLGVCYDANLKDISGTTALFYAKSVEMAEFLISKGADIDIKNDSGNTPLYYAVDRKRYDVAEFLFEQGANPRNRSDRDISPLSIAKYQSKWYTFRLNKLIEKFESYTPKEETTEETIEADE